MPSWSVAQPNLAPLVSALQSIPDGGWTKVNANSFSSAWVPPVQRPLYNDDPPSPHTLITAWGSFAWDSKRGDLLLYGGGHANYGGNEMYRWRGRTRQWELASLPSEIVDGGELALYFAKDGPLNAPASAHTYDNNLYLPLADRFLTFGGASFNSGEGFVRRLSDGTLRATGPYTFDLDRSNPALAGGTTGSHVNRTGAFGNVLGGFMWENRDAYRPEIFGSATAPTNFVTGYTAYSVEGGKEVIYVGGKSRYATDNQLFRFTITDPANPLLDRWEKVGQYWGGNTGAGAAAIDPERKLFVFTGAPDSINPFGYWDLNQASSENRNVNIVPTDLSGEFDFTRMYGAGLDFDPTSRTFKVWTGGRDVFSLVPPTTNSPTGWTLVKEASASIAAPPANPFNEVWGKFKYIPNLNAFMVLEGEQGNVWLYRPYGWTVPSLPTPNQDPVITLTSPSVGAYISSTQSLDISANAIDSDGTIARVEFLIDGEVVGQRTAPPYQISVTGLPIGLRAVTARAVDNSGNATVANPVGVTVGSAPNAAPSVSITSPATGTSIAQGQSVVVTATAADSDGGVARVEFLLDGNLVATVNGSGPYSTTLSGLAVGTFQVVAKAVDAFGAQTTSVPITLTVQAPTPNVPPTARITSPSSNQELAQGTELNIIAEASDSDGTLARVEILLDGLVVRTITRAGPYTATVANLPLGPHTVQARAVDNAGAQTLSTVVQITVVPPAGLFNVVLQAGLNGYSGADDTTLSAVAPNSNLSTDASLRIDRAAVSGVGFSNLLKFRIFRSEGGPVADGAIIESATLSVYKSTTAHDGLYSASRVLKSWDVAAATWSSANASAAWSGAGASGVDLDVSAQSDGTAALGWGAGWLDIDVTAGVTHFSTNGANHGWRLMMVTGDENLKLFHSAQSTSSSLRPKLSVTFRAPNVAPQSAIIAPSSAASYAQGTPIAVQASAFDADGSITRAELLVDGVVVQIASGAGPFSFNVTGLTMGSYVLSVTAVDNLGARTTSAPVTITITPVPNTPPSVSLIAPINGSSFPVGTTINVQAAANDSDGTVAKVEFFVNGTLVLATTNPAPYVFSASGLSIGSHTLSATATDNRGATTSSGVVSISVAALTGSPQTVTLQDGLNGYAGSRDTGLVSTSPSSNFGSEVSMPVSPSSVVLVRFAIFASEGGPVPDGATVTYASLGLYKATTAYDGQYSAQPVTVAWQESQATWAVSSTGIAWGAGGASQIGADVAVENESTATLGWGAGWIDFDVTAAVVAMRQGAGNNGWRVNLKQGSQQQRQIVGSEHPISANRPKLTITYTLN